MISFYVYHIFAFVLILSALFVISAKNPVHSVLFLILAFFNAAGLFVLLGAEFLAFILAIVYVGAVAVLFLFVVMMLDISFADLRKGAMQYIPLGAFIGTILLSQMTMLAINWRFSETISDNVANPSGMSGKGNTNDLGQIIYTDYALIFQMSGMVLLIAMIGAIVLTLRERPNVKRQSVAKQTNMKRDEVVEVKKVTPGTGI
jgi:NADH-quinone oxidoreductase subunit J